MARSRPALGPRDEADIASAYDDGEPIMAFVDYPCAADYTEEKAMEAEMKTRAVLSNNRVVVMPCRGEESSTWDWNERCISGLTGGMTGGKAPGLKHNVEWQCE